MFHVRGPLGLHAAAEPGTGPGSLWRRRAAGAAAAATSLPGAVSAPCRPSRACEFQLMVDDWNSLAVAAKGFREKSEGEVV